MTYSNIFIPAVNNIPETRSTRVREVQFGDAYVQRAIEGINPNVRTFNVTTRTLSPNNAKKLQTDLEATNGQPFYWINPPFEAKMLVRLWPTEITRTFIGGLKSQLSFTLRREFTP